MEMVFKFKLVWDFFNKTTQQLEVHNQILWLVVNGIGRMFTPDQIFARHDEQIVTHWLQEDTFPDSPNFGKLNKDIVAANYFDTTKNSPFGLYQTRSQSYVIDDKGLEVADKTIFR